MQVLFCETWSDFLCARRGPELRQVPQGEAGGLLGLQTQDCRGPHQLQQEVLSPRLHEGRYYFSQIILDGFMSYFQCYVCGEIIRERFLTFKDQPICEKDFKVKS